MSELPELTQGRMDMQALDALFHDLAQLVIVQELQVKGGAQVHASGALDLALVHQALREGRVRGAQLRYRFQDQDWVDTILATGTSATGEGWRLVRMEAVVGAWGG